jgi:hypothetical protein
MNSRNPLNSERFLPGGNRPTLIWVLFAAPLPEENAISEICCCASDQGDIALDFQKRPVSTSLVLAESLSFPDISWMILV